MAARTFKTPDDVDLALAFLARLENDSNVDAEVYFQRRVQYVIDEVMKEAAEKQFNMVKELMDEKNKGASIKKLRDLIGLAV